MVIWDRFNKFSLFSVLNWALMSFNQTAIDSYEFKKVVDKPYVVLQ